MCMFALLFIQFVPGFVADLTLHKLSLVVGKLLRYGAIMQEEETEGLKL